MTFILPWLSTLSFSLFILKIKFKSLTFALNFSVLSVSTKVITLHYYNTFTSNSYLGLTDGEIESQKFQILVKMIWN